MNSRIHRQVAVALCLALVAWAVPASAYRMIQNTSTGRQTSGSLVTCNHAGGFIHWTNSSIPWRLNTSGQGSGKTTAMQNALASWTNVASADHTLTYAGTTAAGWATDGTNTVLFAAGNGCTGTCLALTALVLQTGQVIIESDVTFNSSYTWRTNGVDHDTEAVMAHEFGHSLGIHHTELVSSPFPTMRATYFGSAGRSLETDDKSALQCAQSKYPFPGGSNPPGTPGFLEVRSLYCYGEVILDWTPSTGTTYYELQMSSSSSYTSPTLLYSGANLEHFTNLVTGTKFFRVRACNTHGCSGYRNGDTSATYYSGCL